MAQGRWSSALRPRGSSPTRPRRGGSVQSASEEESLIEWLGLDFSPRTECMPVQPSSVSRQSLLEGLGVLDASFPVAVLAHARLTMSIANCAACPSGDVLPSIFCR
mmetsp:Transcript_27805/g.86560  ORF Transcript_27805/g.86560 Transcript_27805/m.86560 type:complete len:106 (-) Transcript_27805:74-391(-)